MSYIEQARDLLCREGYTCVICGEDILYTSRERGVKPLASRYAVGVRYPGCSAADKVVGRATAFLYLLLEVEVIHATVISRPALELLQAHGARVTYDTCVPYIRNRTGDGICPFEETVMNITDPAKAYAAIWEKAEHLGISINGAKP